MTSPIEQAIACYDNALVYLDEGHLVSMGANLVLPDQHLRRAQDEMTIPGRIQEVLANLESSIAEVMEIQRLVRERRAHLRESCSG